MSKERKILVNLGLVDKKQTHIPQTFNARDIIIKYSNYLSTFNGVTNERMERVLKNVARNVDIKKSSIFHALQTMLTARGLYSIGLRDISAEQPLFSETDHTWLKPDLIARKDGRSIIAEVETMYTQQRGVDSDVHNLSRFVGKMRYTDVCHDFFLSYPHDKFSESFFDNNRKMKAVPLLTYFTTNPVDRDKGQTQILKRYVDAFYRNPPISVKVLENATLRGIFLTDIENMRISVKQY